MPAPRGPAPPAPAQVHAYVKAYAAHFDLLRHVKLRCKLLLLRPLEGRPGWTVVFQDLVQDKFFQVCCPGAAGRCGGRGRVRHGAGQVRQARPDAGGVERTHVVLGLAV